MTEKLVCSNLLSALIYPLACPANWQWMQCVNMWDVITIIIIIYIILYTYNTYALTYKYIWELAASKQVYWTCWQVSRWRLHCYGYGNDNLSRREIPIWWLYENPSISLEKVAGIPPSPSPSPSSSRNAELFTIFWSFIIWIVQMQIV